MAKTIKVEKGKKDTDPLKQPVANTEVVSWKIKSIDNDETLSVVTSPDPYLIINATATPGSDYLDVIINVLSPGTYTHEVPYHVFVAKGGRTVAEAGGYLVIDTIGPPTPPKCRPEDEDERGGGDRQRKDRD